MKNLPLAGFATIIMVAAAHGAVYIDNFNTGYGAVGSDVVNQNGWSINNASDQYSIIASWNSSKSIGLGDASAVDTPPADGSTVALSHAYSEALGRTSVKLDFALIDSSDGDFANRDNFGISLGNVGGDLLSIIFTPSSQSSTPSSGADVWWNLGYSVNGGATVPVSLSVFEGAKYTLDLGLTYNANPLLTNLALSITGAGTATINANGLALNPNTTTTNLGVFWQGVDGNALGSNLILVDNINAIPEPSSALLVGIAGLGLVTSRRRRA